MLRVYVLCYENNPHSLHESFTFCHVLVMTVVPAVGPAGLLYLFVPEPAVLYIVEALISLNILLDQRAPKGQKASLIFML